MPRASTLRPHARVALLAALVMALAACAALAPSSGPVTFREIQREEDVYRITMRWQGTAPSDVEDLMLAHCAEVAKREGASTFFLVNADFDAPSTAYLKDGSPLTPVFRVPEEPPPRGSGSPAPHTSATATIKLFRAGQAPEGYRLYDVGKILRLRGRGTAQR